MSSKQLLVIFCFGIVVSAYASPQPFYVVVGPTGCGKSTFINCMSQNAQAKTSGGLLSQTTHYALYQLQDMQIMDTKGFGDNVALLTGARRDKTGSTEAIIDTMTGLETQSHISGVVYFANSFGRLAEHEVNAQNMLFSTFDSVGIPKILMFNQCADFKCNQAKSNYQSNRHEWQKILGDHTVVYMERLTSTNPIDAFHVSHIDTQLLLNFFIQHSKTNPPIKFSLIPNWREEILKGDPIVFASKMREHNCMALKATVDQIASASNHIQELQAGINNRRSSIHAEISPKVEVRCSHDTSMCFRESVAQLEQSSPKPDIGVAALSFLEPVVGTLVGLASLLRRAPDPVILRSPDEDCIQRVTEVYQTCLAHHKEEQERVSAEFISSKNARLLDLQNEQPSLERKLGELASEKELLNTRLQKCSV